MIKLSAYDVGKKALIILQFKIARQGIDLRPGEFAQYITKNAQRIECPREELLVFFHKFLVPEVLRGCELNASRNVSVSSEQEAKIAFRLLKMGFFWDIRNLREEAYRIAEKTPLEFHVVAAIIKFIAVRHLNDEFGEGDAIKLEIRDVSPE